jgi:hypothetical protein
LNEIVLGIFHNMSMHCACGARAAAAATRDKSHFKFFITSLTLSLFLSPRSLLDIAVAYFSTAMSNKGSAFLAASEIKYSKMNL